VGDLESYVWFNFALVRHAALLAYGTAAAEAVREVLAALLKDLGRWVIWDLVLVFNNVACWPTSLSQLSLLLLRQ
jgi:hypothetical protein